MSVHQSSPDSSRKSMNLRQMEVFRAVMISGGVTSAAQLLHVSAPAVSKVLAQATRNSGLILFERVKGRLVATPEAQRLYTEIASLWHGVDKIRDVSHELAHPNAGVLRLAVTASLAPTLIARTVARLYQRFPRLQCRVRILTSDIISTELVDQSWHLGVALLPHEHPNLEALASYECKLACVMALDHRLAQKKIVHAQDLIGERVIASPTDTPFGQVIRRALAPVWAKLHCDLETTSSTTACWFAQAGTGIALVDQPAIATGALPGLAARPFHSSEALPIRILRNRFQPMSITQRAFVAAFDEVWSELSKCAATLTTKRTASPQ